ncbi:MAG: hypothetical protein QM640_01045 [Niabella sp.]
MKKQTFRGFTLEENSILSKEQLKLIKGGYANPDPCKVEGENCGDALCCEHLACSYSSFIIEGITYYIGTCTSNLGSVDPVV